MIFFKNIYLNNVINKYVKTRDLSNIGNNLGSVACHESKLKKYLRVNNKYGEDNESVTVYGCKKWPIYFFFIFLKKINLCWVYSIYIMYYILDLINIHTKKFIFMYNCRHLNLLCWVYLRNWGFPKERNFNGNGIFVVLYLFIINYNLLVKIVKWVIKEGK